MDEKLQSFYYLKIFFIFFSFLILVSILLKFFFLVTDSSFRNNTFSLLYISKESKVIFVDKKAGSVAFLSVGNLKNIIKGKSSFVASIALGIPINGIIYDADKNENPTFGEFVDLKNEIRLITEFGGSFKYMNEYDLHKILTIARNAGKDRTRNITVNLLDENSVKKNIPDAFLDSSVSVSKYTVEVVNGINVNGLATSLTTVLTRLGYNVVFLQTVSGSYKDDSYIGFQMEKNSFVNSLKDFTKFDEKHKTFSPSADVTIYLGSDLESQFSD